MLSTQSVIEKIKEVLVDINPQEILKDANELGLHVQCVEDFKNQKNNYVYAEKLAEKYGEVAANYCAISGAGTGIGGIATSVALAGVDLGNMAAQLYRLNQKIAILHGFSPSNEIHQEKILKIYLTALGIDAAASTAIRTAVVKAAAENTAKKGPAQAVAIKIVMLTAQALGLKIAKSTAAKAVPFVGAFIGGGINYWFAKKSAKSILLAYKSDYFDRSQSQASQ